MVTGTDRTQKGPGNGAFCFFGPSCNSGTGSSSHEQKHTNMELRTTLLALLLAPAALLAQTDTTATEAPGRTTISAGISSKEGGYVKVQDPDTTKKDNTITINTKRKTITITTEPRLWENEEDSLADRLKDRLKERRNLFTYWSGVDVGVNTLLGTNGSADLPADANFMEIDNARSRFVSINFMEQKIQFGSHHAGLLTGLGLEFTNYHLKENVLLTYNADSISGIPVESPEFRKNKLRQMGLRVPLMLEFNTKRAPVPTLEEMKANKGWGFDRKHNVHLAFGLVGSWYFDTMYKQKYRLDGETRKERDKGDYLLLPYRAAAAVRFGYGSLNLFAEYSLTPLFQDGKGPELTPLNIGLTIVGFD
jgi:hypothetical protein